MSPSCLYSEVPMFIHLSTLGVCWQPGHITGKIVPHLHRLITQIFACCQVHVWWLKPNHSVLGWNSIIARFWPARWIPAITAPVSGHVCHISLWPFLSYEHCTSLQHTLNYSSIDSAELISHTLFWLARNQLVERKLMCSMYNYSGYIFGKGVQSCII